MDRVSLGFLIACLAGLFVSTQALKSERDDAMTVSAMLLCAWAWSKVLLAFGISPLGFYWFTDAVQAAIVGALWASQPAAWKMAILFALLDKEMLHVTYRLGWTGNPHNYKLCLNILFAIELLCASWPGGWRIGLAAGDWWSVRSRWRRRLVSVSGRCLSDKEAPK
jgi:hypothetical protein